VAAGETRLQCASGDGLLADFEMNTRSDGGKADGFGILSDRQAGIPSHSGVLHLASELNIVLPFFGVPVYNDGQANVGGCHA
jgi:hypothetical protein